jgi:hypothetical protein
MTARRGGYRYRDMADARGRALGQALSLGRAARGHGALARVKRSAFAGRSVQILTPGKVNEIFHRDWTAHDRRLAAAGFRPRFDLATGFGDTILWYAQGMALRAVKYGVTNCHFTRIAVSGTHALSYPETWSRFCAPPIEMTVENDGIADHPTLARHFARRGDSEICHHLEPYQTARSRSRARR